MQQRPGCREVAAEDWDAQLELSAVSRTGVLLTADGPWTDENKETEQTASGADAPMDGQPVDVAEK